MLNTSRLPLQRWMFFLMLLLTFVLSLPVSNSLQAQSETVIFAAAGDHGSPSGLDTRRSLEAIVSQGAEFYLALGDMSYEQAAAEPTDGVSPSPWCTGSDPNTNIKLILGDNFPFQLVVGNHEDDDFMDGYINNMALCLPDRMNSTGVYGAEYYFDYPPTAPLMRVIMIGAENDVAGEKYDYEMGNDHYNWLNNTINAARQNAIPWVVVGMHKNCITMGNKSCEIGQDLMNLLIDQRVDLVLQGHDHSYQRSKQLTCATEAVFDPNCVADDGYDGEYTQGLGTVFLINGVFGGGGFTPVNCSDTERDYFAHAMGGNAQVWNGQGCTENRIGNGITVFTVTADRLVGRFVMSHEVRGSGSIFTDEFAITRDGSTTATPIPSDTAVPTTTPTATAEPQAFQPSAPYHATFFYLWYRNPNTDGAWSYWRDWRNNPPNTWFSHYLPNPYPEIVDPDRELYSTNNYEIFRWQLAKLAEAKQEVAIASWLGPGTSEDVALGNILNDYMYRPNNPYPNLRWAIYYEDEGFGDPSVSTIVADLQHIRANLVQSPYFLRVSGKPVVFVYDNTTAENAGALSQRWAEANQQLGNEFYIVLKVYNSYTSTPYQPDSWHQFAPATRFEIHAPHSAYVSPGFWLDDDSAPRLPRDPAEFSTAVQNLAATNVTWRLVETWNEWGEGTSVEPGQEVMLDTTGREVINPNALPFDNTYVQILNQYLPNLEQGDGNNVVPSATPMVTLTSTETPTATFTAVASATLTALTAPTNLNVTDTTATAISLQWSEIDVSETAILLERSDDGINWVQIAELAASSNTHGDLTLTCESIYYYRVRAYRSHDNAYSDYSNVVSQMSAPCPMLTTEATLEITPELTELPLATSVPVEVTVESEVVVTPELTELPLVTSVPVEGTVEPDVEITAESTETP